MPTASTGPPLDRRSQLIEHAADLLRTGGPSALTSVAVADRLGIAQSAVYRYVSNMDELVTLATARLVAELEEVQRDILLATTDTGRMSDLDQLCRGAVRDMVQRADVYDVVDRWRFVDGPFGDAITQLFEHGYDVVETILEHLFRSEFSYTAPFTDDERAAQRFHARVIHDDAHSLARMVRSPDAPVPLDDLATILAFRANAGWVAYVIDMHDRVGLPLPTIQVGIDSGTGGDG